MKPIYVIVALGAYLAVLIQISVLGSWPLFGAQPHLIALGSVVFLVGGRLDLAFIWILVGGGLYDLLLPLPFGWTILPLTLVYGALTLVLHRFFDAPTWLGILILGAALLLGAELPLTVRFSLWPQLLRDLLAGLFILASFAAVLVRRLELQRRGLEVR